MTDPSPQAVGLYAAARMVMLGATVQSKRAPETEALSLPA